MKRVTEKCSRCKNKAVWLYAPSDGEKKRKFLRDQDYKRSLYCEIHVPRGCSCNLDGVFDYDDNTIVDEAASDPATNIVLFSTTKADIESVFNVSNRKQVPRPPNFKWNPNEYLEFEVLDHRGRRWPCCEFWKL